MQSLGNIQSEYSLNFAFLLAEDLNRDHMRKNSFNGSSGASVLDLRRTPPPPKNINQSKQLTAAHFQKEKAHYKNTTVQPARHED